MVADAQGKGKGLTVKGAEFDPERVCDAEGAWVRNIGITSTEDRFGYAFLMHKLCTTATNAAAFGLISGVSGQTLIGPGAIGFDYRDSFNLPAHCGAGAPRFNVLMSDGTFHFLGCANGVHSPSIRGTGWTEVRFDPQNAAHAQPPVPANATIVSIQLVFDEGIDTPGFGGSAEIVLDNIFINGKFATRP